MKLESGVTVHIGGKKYQGEIPDTLAGVAGLKKEKAEIKKTAKSESKTETGQE